MLYSSWMHAAMIVAAIAGGFALVGAWTVGETGYLLGISQVQFYINALILELVSISAGVCTIVRRHIEKETPGSFL